MTTSFLSLHAKKLAEFAAETKAQALKEPDNFFLNLAAKNQADTASEAAKAVALEQADSMGELIDLRLIGARANGSLPLDWFLESFSALTKAWKHAAHHLRYGSEAKRIIPSDVSDALNFKLSGLGAGSTHVYVTANASPDLTGESLLQQTLEQVFSLLNSGNIEFYDAIDAVGDRSAHQLSEFIKKLDSGGYAMDLSWRSPRGHKVWKGRPDEIIRIKALLASIGETDRFEETITGTVAGITDTGRLALRMAEGKSYVRFPLRLTHEVQKLRISSEATLKVETSKYWDSVKKTDILKRNLISVIE